ncbi:hypothetical protein V7183_03680 [Bacillus sp. JJ1127]|uniref:hypothetical protein n=1 Tax=Bacillus sp. JJ1127 TaxID=3122952 RepID=UPI002FFED8BC
MGKVTKEFKTLLTESQRKSFEALPLELQTHLTDKIYETHINHFEVSTLAYDAIGQTTVYVETDKRLYIASYDERDGSVLVSNNASKTAVKLFLHLSENYRNEVRQLLDELERGSVRHAKTK